METTNPFLPSVSDPWSLSSSLAPGPSPLAPSPLAPSSSLMERAGNLVSSLSEEERRELEEVIAADPARMLWSPTPGPQRQAYDSEADELLYGGAAGGGKSALIAGLALTRHRRSLILRRESTQLRGMIDDIAVTLGTRDGLAKQEGRWLLPADKAIFPNQLIELGGVPDPGTEEKHQGIAHDLLAFDEVTQLNEYVVDYLSTWNRSTDPEQRCRMVLASNPPTPSTLTTSRGQATGGGLWLVRRYAPWLDPAYKDPLGLGPARPGELRWFVTLDGVEREWEDGLPFAHKRPDGTVEAVKPKSRTFIPARVGDNPYLADTDYESTLQKLPEPLRSAMLYGDFSVSLSDRPLQLIPTAWLRAANARWERIFGDRRDPASVAGAIKRGEVVTSSVSRELGEMTSLGVDVSRGGTDATILFPRYGYVYAAPIELPSMQTLDGAAVAAKVIQYRRDDAVVVVDAAGVGASAYDHLKHNANLEDKLKGYVGSAKATRRDRSGKLGFLNLRSQTYWLLREALDPTTPGEIAIPPDDDLFQELTILTYTEQSEKIKVIAKEEVVKQLGRSPDKADALAVASTVRDENAVETVAAENRRESRLADADGAVERRYRRALHSDGRRPRWSDRSLPYARGPR